MASSMRSLIFVDIFFHMEESFTDTGYVGGFVSTLHISPFINQCSFFEGLFCWYIYHQCLVAVSQVTFKVSHLSRGTSYLS